MLFSIGNVSIAQGSVVWLYCVVYTGLSTLTLTWTKDGRPLVPNIHHVRIRRSASYASNTLVLVVDSFQDYDNGNYQCTAEINGVVVNGTSLNLRGTLILHVIISIALYIL